MALSPQTAHNPSLQVAAPVNLVSDRTGLIADGSAVAEAGAEWGGEGRAK